MENAEPKYVNGTGWYAVLPTQNPNNRPTVAKGPFRTDDEIEWAIHHYIYTRCPGIEGVGWLKELQCVVLGPYATREAARAATLDDDVPKQPLITEGWWTE